MFKLFRKKLNKKGFTLAELLIVVAIIAILVAIALPIFTGMLEKAQIGVNEANARSVKGAATAEILGDWDKLGAGAKNGSGTKEGGHGWVAAGYVDEKGDVTAIHVFIAYDGQDSALSKPVIDKKTASTTCPITASDPSRETGKYKAKEAYSKTEDDNIAEVDASGHLKPGYWVIVYIKDVETLTAG